MLERESDEHTGLTQASVAGRSLCKLCIPYPHLGLDKTNPKPTRHNESAPQNTTPQNQLGCVNHEAASR